MTVLAILFQLIGCSVFSPVKLGKETEYVINAQVYPSAKYPKRRITLLVTPVTADPIYNTTQMAYSTKPYELAYFAKNRWAETPPQMLQTLLVQTLRKTHYFYAVDSTPISHYNYILNTQLLELKQVFYANTSVIQLKLRVQLINSSTNQVIATKEFSTTQIAPQANPYGGVIAANRSVAALLNQVAKFCLRTL